MTGYTSKCMLLAAVGLTVALGGCKKNQQVQQAPPPPPPEMAPPPPDTGMYGTGYSTPAAAPAPVTEPVFMPTPATNGSGQTYVVQKGDTLMSIARKIYGNPGKFRDIAAANGITDPNKIKVGQTLTLP